ncbi:MAG TPA: hypothetical protein VMV84_01435 [Dehalococcoidales bacterium]|nr:hypothetical protein [Dehalococcoidales bacterium]
MKKRIRILKIGVILTIVLSLATVVIAPPSLMAGVVSEVGAGGFPISAADFSAVPQSVVEDATGLSVELFGDYDEKCDQFVNQLLATYLEAKDKDFIMFFNSGGWGWNLLEISPDWNSIFTGVQSELGKLGYTSLWLNYKRTIGPLKGHLDEFMSIISLHPQKAKDLASRVEFLTDHIPGLRVIIGGESNGAIFCDRAMNILKDNPQVYSIQTGPPFWYKNAVQDRTLVMRSNGVIPDAFSQGDLFTIVCANMESFLGFSKPENSGKILLYLGAPGHEYWWQDPEVHSKITNFLQQMLRLDNGG